MTPPNHDSLDGPSGGGISLELYLRSLGGGAARPQQEAIVDRVDRLADDGAIDGYTVVPWGDGISPSGSVAETDAGRFILGRIEAFEAWADRVGATVPFECRQSKASLVDEGCEEVVLPQMTLATLEGDRLLDVVPFTGDGASYTVDDRLVAHERDESWDWSAPRGLPGQAHDGDPGSPVRFDG